MLWEGLRLGVMGRGGGGGRRCYGEGLETGGVLG